MKRVADETSARIEFTRPVPVFMDEVDGIDITGMVLLPKGLRDLWKHTGQLSRALAQQCHVRLAHAHCALLLTDGSVLLCWPAAGWDTQDPHTRIFGAQLVAPGAWRFNTAKVH